MPRLVLTAFLLGCAYLFHPLNAQFPTDLFLFNMEKTADNRYHIYGPKFLSEFNPGGYTNQPYFTESGNLLISARKVNENQNDIWLLSPSTNTVRRLTKTSSNEYSPRVRPDGIHVSVVRQVEGDTIDQQIFQFPLKGGSYMSLIDDIRDIGYYSWMSEDELALFRLEGESNHLFYYNLKDHAGFRISSAVGRSLFADANGSLLYVHKFDDTYWYIKRYDRDSTTIKIVTETPGKSEDFVISKEGTYFIAHDEKLYFFNPKFHATWQELADLSIYGIKKVSRLAVSDDSKQIAIVSIKE